MIRRFFHLLFGLCFAWIGVLVWNWDYVTSTEGVGPIIVIGAIPLAFVFVLSYLIGQYIDLF